MKLSIITINYNNRDGLQKTIESVVSQTWRDFEWIVIDGGSTDGSKELIEKYQGHFSYWCSEPDKGVYNAMNKGIAKAKGEYLNFMNSGDCFVNNNVLNRFFLYPHSEDILYGYMVRDSIDGPVNNSSVMKAKLTWRDLYYDGLPHQSCFIKRGLFTKYGLYDEQLKAVSDWKFFVKALVYNHSTYKFVPIKVSIYKSGGISDGIGKTERENLKKELFPITIINDIPKIESYELLHTFSLSRICYNILYRFTVYYKNHSKYLDKWKK